MKFYIFGSNSNKFTIAAKKALYKSDDMNSAIDAFNRYAESVYQPNIYLVVDFETHGGFGTARLDNDLDEYIPFFVLAEYHVKDNKAVSRNDRTEIVERGYTRVFYNNIQALTTFLYSPFTENGYLQIVYHKKDKINNVPVVKVFRRKIVTHKELSRLNTLEDRPKPISKFKIQELDWIIPENETKENDAKFYKIPDLKKVVSSSSN